MQKQVKDLKTKNNFTVTKAQLQAIINMTDDMSSMIGCGDHDALWAKYVKLIDTMLKNNGYKRGFN